MKRIPMSAVALLAAVSVLLSGCGESKAAKEARAQGIEQMQAENYADAVASFAIALDEADGVVNAFELDILKYRGEAEYQLGDFAAAAHTYGILTEVDDGKPEYLFFKAASEAAAGNTETAGTDYEQALSAGGDSSTPGYRQALAALAGAYRESGGYEQAIALIQGAIDGGAGSPDLYNQMGLSLMSAGRNDEAVTYLEQGIAAAGDDESVWLLRRNLAAVYEKQGEFAQALTILREYAAANGSDPEIEKEIAFLESR